MSDQNNMQNSGDTGEQNIQAQNNNGNATDNSEHKIPKSRFDQVVQQREEMKATLDEIANSLVEEMVPEDMREVVPDLPAAELIKWVQKARKKGLFGSNQDATNGPDSKRPGGKPPTDFSTMSPYEMRTMGYKK